MWEQTFVQSFIEVLPLISPFLMQFKIKEMKGKPDCEWFYKHDSPGALRRQFCKRLWASIPRKDRDEGMAVPLCAQECGIRMASLSAGETDILDPNRRQWW